ncbi:MAG: M81 family metallopeptidase [Chloroflexota bacterium]|nr:M81 family metallopeptidase [Chloroflexota bacterium]
MPFRIAIGALAHETNTYCSGTTPLEAFRIFRGQDMVDDCGGQRYAVSGMIDAAQALGASIVPIMSAEAHPSGTIAREAHEAMRDELLSGIRAAMPVDAVALGLHGAGVAEGVDDLEGDLCRAVRTLVGPDVPIVVALDIHGNITQGMADAIDLVFGDNYYPEVDAYERGYEAVSGIPRLLSGEWKPVIHVEPLPMLISAATTNLYPAKAAQEMCWESEKRPGIIDVTFFHGFPYTDIPDTGASVVATANGDRDLAVATAQEVAGLVWRHREDFRRKSVTPEEALRQALAIEGGPVVINDTADNPGGGSPGDGTHLLRAMIDMHLQNAAFGFIRDPEVVEAAYRAGAGSTIEVSLGGKSDGLHGKPLTLTAYVKCLTDGKFFMPAWGQKMDIGRSVRLVVDGIDIIVATERHQTFDPALFLLHGIDVSRYKILALKSSAHFRAGFQPIAREIITADSPGFTTLNVSYFERKRTRRPIWPKDADAGFG